MANNAESDMAWCSVITLRPRRNGQHFADDIIKSIFFNENIWISIKISLKFVTKGQLNNIPALVTIMAWRRLGDKPLSETKIASFSTHICVTWHKWVNPSNASPVHLSCTDLLITMHWDALPHITVLGHLQTLWWPLEWMRFFAG